MTIEVEDLKRLQLSPGEILVVRMPKDALAEIGRDTAETIQREFRAAGITNPVLVTNLSVEVEVQQP
jgi:hypothetical protein